MQPGTHRSNYCTLQSVITAQHSIVQHASLLTTVINLFQLSTILSNELLLLPVCPTVELPRCTPLAQTARIPQTQREARPPLAPGGAKKGSRQSAPSLEATPRCLAQASGSRRPSDSSEARPPARKLFLVVEAGSPCSSTVLPRPDWLPDRSTTVITTAQ